MTKNSTAATFTWFAAILLVLGLLVMSPAGSFAVFVLAAIAAIPALFGTKKTRIAAVIFLAAAILLAVNKYPEFKSEHDAFRKHKKTTANAITASGFRYDKIPYSGGIKTIPSVNVDGINLDL